MYFQISSLRIRISDGLQECGPKRIKEVIYILIPVGKAGNISSLSLVFLPCPSTNIPKSGKKKSKTVTTLCK